MSGPIRSKIGPCAARTKGYIEAATVNLGKDTTDVSVKADLAAERRGLRRAIRLLEDCNDNWQSLLLKFNGADRQQEERCYDDFKPSGKHFMERADKTRRAVDTIDGVIGPEDEDEVAESLNSQPAHPPRIQHVQPPPPRHEVNLPPITLPKFTGEPREWPMFWRLFRSSVDNLPIDDFKKHIYLLGCLPNNSPARRAVDLYPPSDENYPRVVDILKKRFGDSKTITESLQAELLHLPKPGESVLSLRNFAESVERICFQLMDFGESEDNMFMASTIKSKLPFSILTHVVEKELSSGKTFSCLDIRKALQAIVEVKEEVQRCAHVLRGDERPRSSAFNSPPQQRGAWDQRGDNRHSNNPQDQPSRPFNRGGTPQPEYRAFSAIKKNPERAKTPARKWGRSCSLCSGTDHLPSECPDFPTPGARRKRLTEQQRCHNCLMQGHRTEECTSPHRCRNCDNKHHFLICFKREESHSRSNGNRSGSSPKSGREPGGRKFSQRRVESQNHLITTEFQPNDQSNPPPREREIIQSMEMSTVDTSKGRTNKSPKCKKPHAYLMTRRLLAKSSRDSRNIIKVAVLFDPGSQTTYGADPLIDKLRPHKLTSEEMEVHGFGGKREPLRFHSPIYSVLLQRADGKWEEILLNRTEKISTHFGMVEWTADEPVTNHHEVLEAMCFTDEEPMILLSARHFWQFFQGKREVSPGLFVINTSFGPLVNGESNIGPPNSNRKALSMTAIHSTNVEQMPTINEVEHFFNLESLGIQDDPAQDDDQTALKLFNESIRQETDGRYSVKWPWKESNPDLPSNFKMAHSRLSSVLIKLRNSPEILEKYDATIRDQLQQGIIEEAERAPGQLEHFLPHHGVLTKKLRVVYDASAHTRGTPSLNSCLFRGPVLLPDLAGMLLRFRCPTFPLLADIQAAFLQISLEPEDREVTKFLWLKDTSKGLTPDNLAIFRFCRVAFGVVSSPFILAATLRHHLQQFNSPLSREISESIYVDNVLLECETVQEALEKYKVSKDILQHGCFNLREFISNSKEVMKQIPQEDQLDKPKAKVLGLPWDTEEDEIIFKFPTTDPLRPVKRRLVLSHLASLFDPLGVLWPCILPAKRLFQELWKEGHSWDDALSKEDTIRWNSIQNQWKDEEIRVPRRAML